MEQPVGRSREDRSHWSDAIVAALHVRLADELLKAVVDQKRPPTERHAALRRLHTHGPARVPPEYAGSLYREAPYGSGGLKGPVASDYPARVTGGWVYILPRGIQRAALVSKQGFLPISPSTVSEQQQAGMSSGMPLRGSINDLECVLNPREIRVRPPIDRSSLPVEPSFLPVVLARDLKYIDVKAQQVVSACPRCGVSRFKPHTVTQAGASATACRIIVINAASLLKYPRHSAGSRSLTRTINGEYDREKAAARADPCGRSSERAPSLDSVSGPPLRRRNTILSVNVRRMTML
ncbi:hypothetical protein K0M31_007631 [Melipona bicolor]|uniref:Uncharacterized protein n=1 Tax=Melipona bicolor TaxID=60889 RepID=A0AA40KW77_9HYME|nr:hypothetical protein K0M31_007631 [Melipona bicolor]